MIVTRAGRMPDAMEFSCPCGAATASLPVGSSIWGCFACHCSMCPSADRRDAFAGGVPWLAVPRIRRWDNAKTVRSSPFAVRQYCSSCNAALSIRYDCEANTDWVFADTLRTHPLDGVKTWHIHCGSVADFGDGRECCKGFEAWEPDPCRPPGTPPPHVCLRCFQKDCAGSCETQST